MKLSYNWLNDFADFESLSFESVLHRISLSVCEVDDVEEYFSELENIICAEIVGIEKHPGADKLNVCRIRTGSSEIQLVSGASNLKTGMKVPLALPGVSVGGKKIEEAELKGIKSSGMLCSEKELGLSQDHSGVMNLPLEAKIGDSLRNILNLKDRILVIDNKSITHRPDLWSHFGFARELAAQLSLPLKFNPFDSKFAFSGKSDKLVKKTEHAHSYYASLIENVEVKESSEKIKSRLTKCGVRTINNVVDVSNYVMLEMGQPTHFFDRDIIGKSELQVSLSEKKDRFKLLDETEFADKDGIVLIRSGEKPAAIAGVMGGFDSGVNDSTKTLIMESAVFRREDVRRSIRKTGIRSEAAVRYEKGQNPFTPMPVIRRSLELLQENGCRNLKAYEPDGFILEPDRKVKIETSFGFIRTKLGKDFKKELILEKLHKLGFKTEEQNSDKLIITVPEYRNQYDILIPEDIVEEVGRSIGYAEIDLLPLRMDVAPALLSESKTLERKLKNVLSERFCYSEVYNYSFAGEKDTQFEGKTETLKIQNSMPEEYSYLRTSVYPGLLKNLRANFDRFEKIRIFELGRTYFPVKGSLGREKKQFGLASVINRKQDTFETKDEDFQTMKNEILHILKILNLPDIRMENFSESCFHPNCAVRFFSGETAVAEAGILHPALYEQYDFKKGVPVLGRLFFDELLPLFTANRNVFQFRTPSNFPQDSFDISLLLDENMGTEGFAEKVKNAGIEEVQEIYVLSIYRGENIPVGKKSVTYRIPLLTFKETFTQARIKEIKDSLFAISSELNLNIR